MKIFIALGGLLVVLLLALLVGPSFVDWTAYRAQFEREASRILGQHVEVKGRASARLLPFPSVTFTNVVVGDDPADPVLTMDGFRMDAELAPYLSGEIRIFHMRLNSPRLSVPIAQDGTIRWPTGRTSVAQGTAVVLEKIEIANGTATIEDQRSRRGVTLSDIDAAFSATSLRGPFTGSGTLFANGEPLRFTLATGVSPGDGTLPLRISAESDRADAAFSLEAIGSSLAGKPLLDGTLLVTSPLPRSGKDDESTTLLPPLRLQSHLSLTPSAIAATDLRAEVGDAQTPYVATGTASLNLGPVPHFNLQLDGQAIDVDAIAPPVVSSGQAPTVDARVEGIRTALSRIPEIDIPGRLRLALPSMTIGDTTIRSVAFSGSPSADGWSIETLSAELPGRTLVQATGLATTRSAPAFRGSLLVASRQPAAFIGWAGGAVDPTLARIDRAGFSATVELAPDTQTFDDLEIDLAGQSLTGSVHRTVRPEARVTAIDLRGDAVDLDQFVAAARLVISDEDGVRDDERFDVQFEAKPFSYHGFRAAQLGTDFTLENGLLDISTFDAKDFAGADLHAEGTIAEIFGDPRPDLSLDVTSEQPERFVDFLQQQRESSPLLASLHRTAETLGPLTLRGTAASDVSPAGSTLSVDFSGTAAGTEVGVKLALQNGLAAARLNGKFGLDLTLRNDEPTVLIDQFGLTALPIGAAGPLSLTASVSGTPGDPATVSASVRAPGTSLLANGTLMLDATGLRAANVKLDANSDDVSPWLTTLGIAAGQPLAGLPMASQANLSWFAGDWTLDGLQGTVGGSHVEADLSATKDEPVTGAVRVSDLSFDWIRTVLTGADEGDGGDPSAPMAFRSPLLPSRTFQVALAAERLTGWTQPVSALQADLVSDAASLRATSLAADIGAGRLEGQGEIRNVAGFVSTKLDLSLRDLPIGEGGGQTLLRGTLGGTVQLEGGGQNGSELVASLDGKGSLTLKDGRIQGISGNLLAPILAQADTDGFSVNSSSVAALVSSANEDAAFPLESFESDVSVGAGTLRLSPFTIRSDDAALAGQVQLDLRNQALAGLLQLTLAPNEDEPVDAPDPSVDYRVGGTLDAPSITANAEPLTSYLSVRAYQREQARIDALQEDLRETVRLRREARLYRWRENERITIRDARLATEGEARAEAERLAREKAETEERAREAERIRSAAETAARAAETAARAAERPPTPERATEPRSPGPAAEATAAPRPPQRSLDFEQAAPLNPPPAVTPPSTGFEGLPGVSDPNAF